MHDKKLCVAFENKGLMYRLSSTENNAEHPERVVKIKNIPEISPKI